MLRDILMLLLVLPIVAGSSAAQPTGKQSSESLKGVKSVYVVVRYQGPQEDFSGLTQKQLQDQVELRIGINNLKVLSKKEWEREPGKPYLYVNIVGTKLDSGAAQLPEYLFSFSANYIERVVTLKHPSIRTEGCTWTEGYSAIVAQEELRTITVKVSDLAYEFVRAVESAAPSRTLSRR